MVLLNIAPDKFVFVKLTSVKSAKLKLVLVKIPFRMFAPLIFMLVKSCSAKQYLEVLTIVIEFEANVADYRE